MCESKCAGEGGRNGAKFIYSVFPLNLSNTENNLILYQ